VAYGLLSIGQLRYFVSGAARPEQKERLFGRNEQSRKQGWHVAVTLRRKTTAC
jgi:hypothetical protein